MGVINYIKNLFRKGAVKIGAVESLGSILDHPKIAMEQSEYQRIKDSLRRYEGKYKPIRYKNSNKVEQKRNYSTVNMLKKVAGQYATVVFNEQCEITVEGPASDFVSGVFEHNDFKKNFAKYLEPMFSLGGLACRPYYDKDSKQIEFSWALADAFYPLESNSNNISECAIPFVTTRALGKETIYYTLIEFHEWVNGEYVITNELYQSEDHTRVGARINLGELYPDLEETVTIKGLSRPLFAYLKPSGFNNISPYSQLGLGVCDNCKDTLDRINRTYDEFDQEIKKGKRRIAASEMLLDSKDELGRVKLFFDDDEDTFQIIPGANMDDYTIKDLTSDIRTTEYVAAINHHLKTLEMETGLSRGTFTFDTNGNMSTKTATEVVSENSQTYQTRAMQITEVEKFIKELVVSVCELGIALNLYTGEVPEFKSIGVDFDDGAFQDKDAQLAYYQKLVALGYPVAKVFEKVLDLPEKEAQNILAQGLRETATRTTGMFNDIGVPEEEE